MILICCKCGKKIERTKKQKDPVCFECRKERRREATLKRKKAIKAGTLVVKKKPLKKPIIFKDKKFVINMVENPHEDFSKFSKKLIYRIPFRLNKKTVEYNSWLTRDYFARQHCCKCDAKLIFLCRKDNPYNISPCCPNENCCLHSDYRKITTWKRIKKPYVHL